MGGGVINDPVHGIMRFEGYEYGVVRSVLAAGAFQRLRHIKQLGMADLVFPGAVHTRFNHSLGSAFVGRELCERLSVDKSDRKVVLAACLLHDIGHGPFSHAFEELFGERRVKHEAWTSSFLGELKEDLDVEAIIKLIEGTETKRPILADIVSSQLDADRLDYLLRDSHFCGVSYGMYDLKWLLNCVCVQNLGDSAQRFGVTQKGVGVVEQFLMSRRLMTQNVYYHGKVKAAEHLLIVFLKTLARTIEDSRVKKLVPVSLAQMLVAASQYSRSAGDQATFIKHNFKHYRELCDYDVWTSIRSAALCTSPLPKLLRETAVALHHRRLPEVFHVENDGAEAVRVLVHEFKKKHRLDDRRLFLLEPSVQAYKSSRPILVKSETGAALALQSLSQIASAFEDRSEGTRYLVVDDLGSCSRLVKELHEKRYLSRHHLTNES